MRQKKQHIQVPPNREYFAHSNIQEGCQGEEKFKSVMGFQGPSLAQNMSGFALGTTREYRSHAEETKWA